MKNKLIKSTILLLVGGLITKIFSMLIKITIARNISPNTLGIYMMIMPTFSLFISLGQFGLPLAISKLVSEQTRNNKKLIFSILPIIILINIVLIIIIIMLAPIISNTFLKNKDTYIPILSISLVIPFTTISNICRSYFFGKEKMLPHVVSNISEDLIRYIILLFFLPKIISLNTKYIVTFLILVNIISELSSTIILLLFLPSKITITKKDLIPNKKYIKDSLEISIPTTTSRLVGSISYFLEPIILTNLLSLNGFTNKYITSEYGIITGYVMPLLLLPSFFTLAISQAILPVISRQYNLGNKKYVYKKIKTTVYITMLLSIILISFLIINSKTILFIIYHTTKGVNYLKILAPIFILLYIQSPLSFSLDAIGKSKDNLSISIINVIIRLLSLSIFSMFKIGIYSLIISLYLSIITTSILQFKKIKKHFQKT